VGVAYRVSTLVKLALNVKRKKPYSDTFNVFNITVPFITRSLLVLRIL